MVRTAIIVGSAILLAAGVVGLQFASSDARALLQPDDHEVVRLGSALYAANCASCHGADLEGQANWTLPGPTGRMPAPPHDASGHTWHHDDEMLFGLTKHGVASVLGGDTAYRSDMPAYADILTDEQIIAVLSFIKSTWPSDVRDAHDKLNERTKADTDGS